MAAAGIKTTVDALREPFPLDLVYSRQGPGNKQLDYVAIETVLERLLTVAPHYSMAGKLESLSDNTAVVSIHLTIGDKTGFGIGEMTNPSVDMAVKSATSEAIKNAAKNGFGIGLELWNADYRDQLATQRKQAGMTEAQLKAAVFNIARTRLDKAKPSAVEIGKLFDVDPSLLTDEATLRAILVAESSS